MDVFYDHFLACLWSEYHPEPLEQFAERVYRELDRVDMEFPGRMPDAMAYLRRHDLLVKYRELGTVERSLAGISKRLARINPLDRALIELEREYGALEADFRAFFPALTHAVGRR